MNSETYENDGASPAPPGRQPPEPCETEMQRFRGFVNRHYGIATAARICAVTLRYEQWRQNGNV